MIQDSFMVCCDCTQCKMTSESSFYFYLRVGNLCHSRPLHQRKSAMKFGFGQSDRWHRGAVTAMPFPSINQSPASISHHSSHLTGTRGSVPGPKVWLTPRPIFCKHLEISAPPAGKISDLCERGLSSWPWLKSAGARYDTAWLVRGSNKMLSDLAPLEMSAPEPADARLSEVGECTAPTGSAAACKKQGGRHIRSTRQDKQQRRTGPLRRIFAPFPHISATSYVCFSLSEKCICYRPAAAAAETDLCCPSARCAEGTTKSMRDDDVGKSRNWNMPKWPIIALVNHVKGDRAPKRHPTQTGTQSRHSLSDCSYLPCRQTHFFSPRGNSRDVKRNMFSATHL